MSNILINNYKTTLVNSLGIADTQMYVGHSLPALQPGDYYLVTLFAKYGADESNWEIVKVTAAGGSVLTISRGQEGTAARNWDNGTLVEMRLTAGQITGKTDVGHTHAISDVTGLQTALDGKASTAHTHSVSDITGLTAAGEFTATASGNLTAGKGVVVNTNGSVSTVAVTADTVTTTNQSSLFTFYSTKPRYIPSLGVIVHLQSPSPGVLQVLHGKITNSVVTWEVKYSYTDSMAMLGACVGDDGTVGFVLSPAYFQTCSPTGVWSTKVSLSTNGTPSIAPKAGGGFYIAIKQSGVTSFYNDAGGFLGSVQTATGVLAGACFTINGSSFFAYSDAYSYPRILSLPNLSVVASPPLGFSSVYGSNPVAYDSNGNFILFGTGGTSLSFGTFNGSTFTALGITNASASSNQKVIDYDAEKSIFVFAYINSSNQLVYRTVTHTGSAIAESSDTILRSTVSTGSLIVDIPNNFLYVGCNDGSSTTYNFKLEVKPTNAKKAIGIPTGSVTSGATATIKCIGGVYETTGLTAGMNYYLSSDGTLTTNANLNGVFGVALTSTKLLVTKGELL